MKKIIISLIIFLFSFNFVLAQETVKIESVPNWLKNSYQLFNNKIVNPVKQGAEKIPEVTEGLFKKIQRETEQKQAEVKQEIKKEVKKEAKGWVEEKIGWVEEFLSPLKIKIQQGSTWVRQGVNKVRNFLFNSEKE